MYWVIGCSDGGPWDVWALHGRDIGGGGCQRLGRLRDCGDKRTWQEHYGLARPESWQVHF